MVVVDKKLKNQKQIKLNLYEKYLKMVDCFKHLGIWFGKKMENIEKIGR